MEARSETIPRGGPRSGAPTWVLFVVPLALIATALALFGALGAPGERVGPPVEELAVERTVLRPGEIELHVRNTGPDPVTVAQVAVADAFVDFEADPGPIGRLETRQFVLDYPWAEGSPYVVSMLTETGVTIEHEIPLAVATPEADGDLYALMGALGTYVGIVPVVLGMLFLPFMRRARERMIRGFLAFTVGLLAFLAIDGSLEALDLAAGSSGAFGGAELLFLGAIVAFLALTGVDRWLTARRERAGATAGGYALALMIAIGIGLHNMGEGLAIGSAYALGELALGAFLVIGFALHNTTEGLAIVAPLTRRDENVGLGRLALLGVIAGAPAILGALIGASVNSTELSVFLLGVGVGAIVQVIGQIVPAVRDDEGRALNEVSVPWIAAGVLALYATGFLITV